jgi:2-C-methyl-D-erythritol 4-phosphate cytidylyltransferase
MSEPTSGDRLWAVLPAAGRGSRFGGERPKQYRALADGRTLLETSIRALLSEARVDGVMVALAAVDTFWSRLPVANDPRVATCEGGAERADSVRLGLRELIRNGARATDWVLVHDAARPGLASGLLTRLVNRCLEQGHGGILALPVRDTLKREDGAGGVRETVDRSGLWQAQTPQMFRLGLLLEALEAACHDGWVPTDEAAAMERAGHPAALVEGSLTNLKITDPDDLAIVNALLFRG